MLSWSFILKKNSIIYTPAIIGLYEVPSIEANVIVSTISDALIRMNLTLSKVRGQCYDGASNMSGLRNGVARQIKDMEKKDYTHIVTVTL